MMFDITGNYNASKEKHKNHKKLLKHFILKFIFFTNTNGKCILCNKRLIDYSNLNLIRSLKDNCLYTRNIEPFNHSNRLADENTDIGNGYTLNPNCFIGSIGKFFYSQLSELLQITAESNLYIEEDQIMTSPIEEKLCQGCCYKIHQDVPEITLIFYFQNGFAEFCDFTKYLNSISHHKDKEDLKISYFVNIPTINLKDIEPSDKANVKTQHFEPIFENSEYNKNLEKLREALRVKYARDKYKTLKLKQIEYKIAMIDEQCDILLENYRNAINRERFEDAKVFISKFDEIYSAKISLHEQLEGWTKASETMLLQNSAKNTQ